MTRLPHVIALALLALAVDLIRRLTPPAPDRLHKPATARLTGYHTSTDRELRNGRDVADTDEWGHAGGA